MSNTIFITANWTTGALSQQTISRQYDNNRYAVQFIGYPEGDGTEELDLYLLVWMSTAPGQKPGEITPIQLNSDQWYISNYFTQQVQVIKFQLCVLNEAGTYEAHSPIFSGRIGDSLEHDGTSHDIDVSTLFDAYREYIEELIIAAGAMIIDPTPTQGSANAVQSGGVYSALAGKVDAETGKGLSTNDYTDAEKQKVTDATADLTAMTTATADDVGKALVVESVTDGKATFTFAETGGDTSELEQTVATMNSFGSGTTEVDKTSEFVSGGYYNTNGDVGTIASTTLVSNTNYKGLYFAVSAGDEVTLTAKNITHNVWALTDSEYTILSKSGTGEFTDVTITASVDGYCFVNTQKTYSTTSVVLTTSETITLHDKMDSVDADIDAVEASATANATTITKKIPYPVDGNGDVVLPSSASGIIIGTDGTASYGSVGGSSSDDPGRNIAKIPNIVVDPMFTDLSDTDAIEFTNATGESDGDGVLDITVSNAIPKVYIKIADTESTDLIFYSVKVAPVGNTLFTRFESGGSTITVADGVETVIDGVTTGGTGKYFYIYHSSKRTITATITMPIVVNLTAVFGSGHEPTYTQFKAMLENNWTRDDFKTWISRQKYDHILGSPKLYATNYWVIASNASKWTDVEKTVTGDGSKASITAQGTSFSETFTAGDVIYYSAWLKASGEPTALRLTDYYSSSSYTDIATQDSPTADTWYRLSGLRTFNSGHSTRYTYTYADYADETAQSGQTLTYKEGLVLNLTEIFGAGNEPTDATVIDEMLSRYTNYWFAGSGDIWNPSIIPWLAKAYREFTDGTYLGLDDSCIKIGSVVDTSWDGWDYRQRYYGLNKNYSPVFNQVHGIMESDGMFSVIPNYGRWGWDALGGDTTEAGDNKGGHVFEGWNRHGTYRLTLMIAHGKSSDDYGEVREDEACIITYCPGVFDEPMVPFTEDELANRMTREPEDYYNGVTAAYMLGRVRIGSDVTGEGAVFRRKRTTFYGHVFFDGSYGSVNSSRSPGEKGKMLYDENYLYICVADNTWRRVALETF